jgi:hypothetical protein
VGCRLGNSYQIQISNRFVVLENLNDIKDINGAWENIKEILGLYEWQQYKPRFGKKCSCFLDQRKQAKMQLLQHQN